MAEVTIQDMAPVKLRISLIRISLILKTMSTVATTLFAIDREIRDRPQALGLPLVTERVYAVAVNRRSHGTMVGHSYKK